MSDIIRRGVNLPEQTFEMDPGETPQKAYQGRYFILNNPTIDICPHCKRQLGLVDMAKFKGKVVYVVVENANLVPLHCFYCKGLLDSRGQVTLNINTKGQLLAFKSGAVDMAEVLRYKYELMAVDKADLIPSDFIPPHEPPAKPSLVDKITGLR